MIKTIHFLSTLTFHFPGMKYVLAESIQCTYISQQRLPLQNIHETNYWPMKNKQNYNIAERRKSLLIATLRWRKWFSVYCVGHMIVAEFALSELPCGTMVMPGVLQKEWRSLKKNHRKLNGQLVWCMEWQIIDFALK